MQGVRTHYAAVQAARSGDRKAFDIIWQECHEPLRTVVRRTLDEAEVRESDRQVTAVLNEVRDRSFEELQDKPEDWSMYGWLSWIAQREALITGRTRP